MSFGEVVQFAVPPSPASTIQTPDTILVASRSRLNPTPIIRVYLGNDLDLRASNYTAEAQFISDDGRSTSGYTASPIVKDRDDGFIYFVFSTLSVHASPGTKGTLEFRVYRDGGRYGRTLRSRVFVIDGREMKDKAWLRQRMDAYEGSRQGECDAEGRHSLTSWRTKAYHPTLLRDRHSTRY